MVELGRSFTIDRISLPVEASKLEMIWVSPGTFMAGSKQNEPGYDPREDGTPFQATLKRGYWLSRYLITQAHWQAIMLQNPSYFQEGGINRPIENVNWTDTI